MTQNELNFIQEAMYTKCDTLLQTIADNNNALVKKEKTETKTTKKGENK